MYLGADGEKRALESVVLEFGLIGREGKATAKSFILFNWISLGKDKGIYR